MKCPTLLTALALATLSGCLGTDESGGTTPIDGVTGDAGTAGGGTGGDGAGGQAANGGTGAPGGMASNGGTASNGGAGAPGGEPGAGGEPDTGGTAATGGSGGPGGEPGTGGFVPVDCGSGFGGAAQRWSLPFPLGDQHGLGGRSHLVMDLTGDGIIDLVVYEPSILPEPDARVGRAYWYVYPGGESGFAAAPLRFSLPFSLDEIGEAGQFSSQRFVIAELTGDRRPDFVVLRPDGEPGGDARISRAWWLVFENTGTGFSDEGARFTLPYPLDADRDSSAFYSQSHAVIDVDADGRPDFVNFRNGEAPEADPRIGHAYWHLHRNTGTGFASEAARFPLPFDLNADAGDVSDPTTQGHALAYLRGPQVDFRPEFLLTTDDERPTSDARLGRARWDLYANDGAGFSDSATPFALPFPLSEVAGAYLGGYVGQNHAVLDLTGDGLPDLVVHRAGVSPDEDARLGRAHWLLYRNTGDGFADSAERWTLPVPLAANGDDGPSAPATEGHALLRLADPCLSLLFFDDRELPDSDARIGRAYWTYYRSE